MIVVVVAAAVAFTLRFDPDLFAVVIWALFLCTVSTSTMIAWFGRGERSRFAPGYAIFGWIWLACGLRFGLLPSNQHLLQHSVLGIGFGVVSGYAVSRLARL
jgi:hypothetical protein